MVLESQTLEHLQRLCRVHGVRQLFLFGSAVRGELTEESDLDFLVEFRKMPPSEHADAYFGLLHDLESLFDRRIDLLELTAIDNPYLSRSIEESKQLLYEAA